MVELDDRHMGDGMNAENKPVWTAQGRFGDDNCAFDQADEQAWLMSLALDGELDEADAARLEELLANDSACFTDWQRWQALDDELRHMPCVLPPVDFAGRFDARLALWERRRKLRTGILFGLAALAIWVSALAGVIGLGVFFWSNQVEWMAGAVNQATLWWLLVTNAVETVLSGVQLFVETPQTWVVLVSYLGVTVAILSGWFTWLRRSLGVLPGEVR